MRPGAQIRSEIHNDWKKLSFIPVVAVWCDVIA